MTSRKSRWWVIPAYGLAAYAFGYFMAAYVPFRLFRAERVEHHGISCQYGSMYPRRFKNTVEPIDTIVSPTGDTIIFVSKPYPNSLNPLDEDDVRRMIDSSRLANETARENVDRVFDRDWPKDWPTDCYIWIHVPGDSVLVYSPKFKRPIANDAATTRRLIDSALHARDSVAKVKADPDTMWLPWRTPTPLPVCSTYTPTVIWDSLRVDTVSILQYWNGFRGRKP